MTDIKKAFDLALFAGAPNTNVTTDDGMTAEMKTYYVKELIRNAQPNLVHDQFGQKRNIPANGGRQIEFRRLSPLPKALTPLTEAVTPDGQKMTYSTITAAVRQYGAYITLSDVLILTAIDRNLVQAMQILGDQAGRTLDTITREVLCGGTNVQYAEGQVTAREDLVGGSKTEGDNCYMTVKAIRNAVRTLRVMNTKPFGQYYIGILHPDVAEDIMDDPLWTDVKKYSDPSGIYEGEIGRLAGVRWVQTTEAKVYKKAAINKETGSPVRSNRDVYATLIMGQNAYGVTSIEGGGLQHIVKQLGSAGSADPLNQRATAGWKAMKTAIRLTEEFMVRVETCSQYNDTPDNAA